jgi:small subunit ribosomal protein S17
MQNTVTVKVDRTFRHPLYQKVLRGSKNYLVHDEFDTRPGDRVRIVECRPISKRKRWAIEEVLKRGEVAE